ncbi:hypothetical protein B0H10DRAFT_2213499 [Mycena sp. CBHHK59/15]|nr:hypothetical protein B0H10DRAFT_2213499 [Mycena sp. CBHHK59/15]
MSPAFPILRFTALSAGLLGVGYLLLKTTAANEEEAYKRLSPDARRRVDEARALREAQEAEIRARVFAKKPLDPESVKPSWADVSRK